MQDPGQEWGLGERSEWREGCEKSWSGAWERGVSGGRDVRSLGVGLGREE